MHCSDKPCKKNPENAVMKNRTVFYFPNFATDSYDQNRRQSPIVTDLAQHLPLDLSRHLAEQ
uniref:Uncharacterized protein n=1 Tax=Romanomermis culicivorax TaxID=13658 RepID=A0A915INK5_ROMCU